MVPLAQERDVRPVALLALERATRIRHGVGVRAVSLVLQRRG